MKLIIDAGNTNIVFGISNGPQWDKTWRVETNTDLSTAYFELTIRNELIELDINPNDIDSVVISSVVPELNNKLFAAVRSSGMPNVLLLDSQIFRNLDMLVPKPDEIGSDLVANAYMAWKTYPLPAVVVDFGTALSFTIVSEKGIDGVIITPGLKTAVNALFSKTAKLPVVPLSYPESVIGKSTNHAIQSGVLVGYVGLVKHLLEEIDRELGSASYKIATGGLHSIIQPLEQVFHHQDINLTMNGLCLFSSSNQST